MTINLSDWNVHSVATRIDRFRPLSRMGFDELRRVITEPDTRNALIDLARREPSFADSLVEDPILQQVATPDSELKQLLDEAETRRTAKSDAEHKAYIENQVRSSINLGSIEALLQNTDMTNVVIDNLLNEKFLRIPGDESLSTTPLFRIITNPTMLSAALKKFTLKSELVKRFRDNSNPVLPAVSDPDSNKFFARSIITSLINERRSLKLILDDPDFSSLLLETLHIHGDGEDDSLLSNETLLRSILHSEIARAELIRTVRDSQDGLLFKILGNKNSAKLLLADEFFKEELLTFILSRGASDELSMSVERVAAILMRYSEIVTDHMS